LSRKEVRATLAFCMENMEVRWYVVHTYSGYENKVKTNLERRVKSMDMEDKIFRVLVPMEEEIETKNGKRKSVMKKVFPGYVLVEMIMTDDSWYVVRNTPGVTGFVGSSGAGSKPTPLLPSEARAILKQMGVDTAKPKVDFSVKEAVRVVEGPFENFVGSIEEIYPDKQKLKVLVSMFGRETPVELDFDQVEKL
jgi:transcriptional antiterminator NusG